MSKADEAKRELIDLRKRVADLESQLLGHEDESSKWAVERATFQRQVANLTRDNEKLLERIGWVRSLTDGSMRLPTELHIKACAR